MNPTLQHGIDLAKQTWMLGYGHALEFGVAAGTTMRQIIANLGSDSVHTFGFDSCVGLPEDWPGTVCKAGAFSNNGNIPDTPGITKFYKGWFTETVPEYLADFPEDIPIILLHLDADLYSSTITILRGLNSRIKVGTVIVCDEWGFEDNQPCVEQERRAVYEWQETFGRELEQRTDYVDNSPCGNQRAIFVVTK
jgi:hypothetical protein